MSTLYSNAVGSTVQPRASLGVNVVIGTYTVTSALALNDVIQMVKVPAGAIIDEITIETTDLDTGSTAAIVLDVGDADDPDRFIDGSTIGKTGGVDRLKSSLGYAYEATSTINIKVATAPATGATSGTIKLLAQYHMNGFN